MPDNTNAASIPLQAVAPASNPLSTVSGFAETQNALNQARLFNQKFNAMTLAGKLIAGAPDLESGLAAVQSNPLTAAYGGEVTNNIRQSMLAMTQMQGEQQKQYESALAVTMKFLPEAATDPRNFRAIMSQALSGMSPYSQKAMKATIENMGQAFFGGLDGLADDQAKAKVAQRLGAAMAGTGTTPEGIAQVFGKTGIQDLGGSYQPYTQAPSTGMPSWLSGAGPGQVTGVQAPVAKGIAPSYQPGPAGATPFPGLGGGGFPGAGGAVPTAGGGGGLTVGQPRTGGDTGGGHGGTGGTTPQQSGGNSSPSSSTRQAGDATPLYTSGGPHDYFPSHLIVTNPNTGQYGWKSPDTASESAARATKYTDADLKTYNATQTAMGQLQEIGNSIDALGTEGWLTPGPMGNERKAFAAGVNTLFSVMGIKPEDVNWFDPSKVATAEEAYKDVVRLGSQLVNQYYGGSKEAASLVANITSSVPGIENTPKGAHLIIRGLTALLEREQDRYDYMGYYQNDLKHYGSLMGVDQSFNADHPMKSYVNRALDSVGANVHTKLTDAAKIGEALKSGYIDKEGAVANLRSPQEAIDAIISRTNPNGWLSPEEVEGIVKDKWPDVYKAFWKKTGGK